jgi:hypothetical protein
MSKWIANILKQELCVCVRAYVRGFVLTNILLSFWPGRTIRMAFLDSSINWYKLNCRRKMDFQFLINADFLYDNDTVSVAWLRDTTKWTPWGLLVQLTPDNWNKLVSCLITFNRKNNVKLRLLLAVTTSVLFSIPLFHTLPITQNLRGKKKMTTYQK